MGRSSPGQFQGTVFGSSPPELLGIVHTVEFLKIQFWARTGGCTRDIKYRVKGAWLLLDSLCARIAQ